MLTWLKTFLSQYWAAIIILISPIQAALATIVFIVFIDLLLGLFCARKKKIKITSFKLRKTVVKLLCYLLAFTVSYFLELYLLPFFQLSKIVASFIGLVEFKSILENLNILSGGEVWKAILKRLNVHDGRNKR